MLECGSWQGGGKVKRKAAGENWKTGQGAGGEGSMGVRAAKQQREGGGKR